MNAVVTRFDDAVCGVCARSAVGFGYAPRANQPTIWVCDDPDCLQISIESYTMKQDRFSEREANAAVAGADAMGQRLDDLGEGDRFNGLSHESWLAAMRAGIAAYRVALQNECRNEAPF
mgnify:FL=1